MVGCRRRHHGARTRGLTLVELLIASTMVVILFIGLGAHLRGGITVWRRTTDTVEQMQRRRAALDRLAEELANAFVYSAAEGQAPGATSELPQAEFTADHASWYAALPFGGGQDRSVRFITYACESLEDTKGLWRWSRPVSLARRGNPVPAELALDGCDGLALRYAYLASAEGQGAGQLEWRPLWVSQDKLPRLVELTLTLDGETLRRVVVLPAGILKVYEPPAAAP